MESYELEALEAVTTRPAYPYRTLTVERITPVLGAEVSGVDLSQEIPAEQLDEIRTAFRDHHVCLLYTSPSPRDGLLYRMPSSA